MTAEKLNYALNVLWFTSLVLPYVTFIVKNNFTRKSITLLRAAISIGYGWLLIIAYAILANAASIVRLSFENLSLTIPSGDGAALAFSILFGWVIPLIIVLLAWIVHGWMPKHAKNKASNPHSA